MEKEILSQVLRNLSYNIKAMCTEAFDECNMDDIMLILNAYNRYQEDEKDGVDYIFDLSNKEDIITCVNGGMSVKEIASLHIQNVRDYSMTNFFLFGVNHKEPKLLSYSQFGQQLLSHTDEIAECVLAFPWVNEYRVFYTKFITNEIVG